MVKYLRVMVVALVLMLQACSSLPSNNSLTDVTGVENMEQALRHLEDPEHQTEFTKAMKYVADTVSQDPRYKRIPLDTPDLQEWFTARAFLLWDGQISKEQFIKFGTERFPQLESSFLKVASLLAPQNNYK